MCKSSLLILSSQMLMIFLKARCLSSSSALVMVSVADVIIATSDSAQRQVCEKPTSPLPVVVGGILALVMLSDDP